MLELSDVVVVVFEEEEEEEEDEEEERDKEEDVDGIVVVGAAGGGDSASEVALPCSFFSASCKTSFSLFRRIASLRYTDTSKAKSLSSVACKEIILSISMVLRRDSVPLETNISSRKACNKNSMFEKAINQSIIPCYVCIQANAPFCDDISKPIVF